MDLNYEDSKLKNEKKLFEFSKGRYEYSKINTMLSNERTFYSYTRTALAIFGFAFKFKSKYLAFIGCMFLLCGFYNYYNLYNKLEKDKIRYPNKYYPMILTILSVIGVYLLINKEKILS